MASEKTKTAVAIRQRAAPQLSHQLISLQDREKIISAKSDRERELRTFKLAPCRR